MNTAIIVAAGSGTRFGGELPKQFLEIGGKPILIHTLERFENCSIIDEIVLVLAPDQIERFRRIASAHRFGKLSSIVAGGKTRAESVYNGWRALVDAAAARIVVVHDGARPLVTGAEISATVRAARSAGAACLVAPVTDTIKEVAGGRIVRTIERGNLRRALTPQAFRHELLQKAFAEADLSATTATDESFLVEQLGHPIAVVEGSPKNIKITTREDLAPAEIYLREMAESEAENENV